MARAKQNKKQYRSAYVGKRKVRKPKKMKRHESALSYEPIVLVNRVIRSIRSPPSFDMSKEASSSYIPSNSEVTKSLKRTLQNEFDIDSNIKKIKLDNSKEELIVVNTVNTKALSICLFKSLVGRLVELADSVDPSYGTCKDPSCCNYHANGINYLKKISVSEESNHNSEDKSSNENNCVSQVIKNYDEITENNGFNKNIQQSFSRTLSSENEVMIENSSDNDVEGDSPIANKRLKVVNESTLTFESNLSNSNTKESKVNNIESNKNNDLQLCMYNNAQTSTKSVDVIELIEYEQENNNNEGGNETSVLNVIRNSETIESDRGSHDDSNVSDDDSCVSVDESEYDGFMNIIESIKQNGNKPATSELLQLFHLKDNLPERWNTFVKYKVIEYLTVKDIRGAERSEGENIIQRNIIWRKKWESMNKSLDDLRNRVSNRYKNLPNTTKNQITLRSVSLQAELCSINEDGQPSEPLRLLTPLNKSVSSSVDIISDDDIVLVDTEESNKSFSNTSEVITKRKHSSSSITSKQLMVSTTKAVPPAIPIDSSNNTSTNSIDLTENDEIIEVPSRLKLDKTYKIIKCSTTNTSVPATLSTQLTENLPIQALSKNVTFIEIPKLPTSSNYFLKTTTATGSNQLPTISSLKTVNIEPNSSLQHFAIKSSGKPLPTNLSQIVDPSQLQPRKKVFDQRKILLAQLTKKPIKCIPLTSMSQPTKTQQISLETINAQPISSKTTNVQQFNFQPSKAQQISPKTINIQQSFQPAKTQQISLQPTKTQHISSQFSKPQSIGSHQLEPLQPVPTAIPIVIRHPAPLPSILNQRSLPSWKKLPPSPVLTVERINRLDVLLSWKLPKLHNKPSNARVKSFQVFVYHVTHEKPRTEAWTQISEIKNLSSPMGCEISNLRVGHKYYFAVRSVDVYDRIGPFCLPKRIFFN